MRSNLTFSQILLHSHTKPKDLWYLAMTRQDKSKVPGKFWDSMIKNYVDTLLAHLKAIKTDVSFVQPSKPTLLIYGAHLSIPAAS